MTISEKKQKLLNIMDQYYVAFKLLNSNVMLDIQLRDSSIYDPWDWNNPYCYTVSINNINNYEYVKGCINLEDGECVLDINHINKSGIYLQEIYDKNNKNKIRSGHLYFNKHYKCQAELCFADDSLFFEVLEKYLQLS